MSDNGIDRAEAIKKEDIGNSDAGLREVQQIQQGNVTTKTRVVDKEASNLYPNFGDMMAIAYGLGQQKKNPKVFT